MTYIMKLCKSNVSSYLNNHDIFIYMHSNLIIPKYIHILMTWISTQFILTFTYIQIFMTYYQTGHFLNILGLPFLFIVFLLYLLYDFFFVSFYHLFFFYSVSFFFLNCYLIQDHVPNIKDLFFYREKKNRWILDSQI